MCHNGSVVSSNKNLNKQKSPSDFFYDHITKTEFLGVSISDKVFEA